MVGEEPNDARPERPENADDSGGREPGGTGGGFGPPVPPAAPWEAPAPGYGPPPATAPGWAGAGTIPPPPAAPPGYGPPPGQPPRGEPKPAQAVLVGLLNLSCLGLGYVLLRHWLGAALCWAATAALLLLALPADVDGVPGGLLVGYGIVLLLAAADGARRGLRAELRIGAAFRRLALPLAVVLLAVPAGGSLAYGAARDEAIEQSLLDRLAAADALVRGHEGQRFASSETDYRAALAAYQLLARDHADSRAGKLVPSRLDAYYKSVATPYDRKDYCQAVPALTHLRELPATVDKALLGSRPATADEPLAHSLYECGVAALGTSATPSAEDSINELTRTFPRSPYIARVGPAVQGAVDARAAELDGAEPCATTDDLRTVRASAAAMTEAPVDKAVRSADRALEKGVFACGTDQFKEEEFEESAATMTDFVKDYPKSARADHARAIAIAAEIAQEEPAAGKTLPRADEPGGARMVMVVSNDAPDEVELLYTGPVTGKITLKPCAGCRNYDRFELLRRGFKPCAGPSSKYPKATITLPAGNYHLLQKRTDTDLSSAGDTKTSKAKIEPGYSYTNCLYVTEGSSLLQP
ncbi:hypothetical protein [Streptomyces sp. NPDC003327]